MDIKNEVERQFNILKRGCEEIINEAELKLRLEKSLKENKPLKIKLGTFLAFFYQKSEPLQICIGWIYNNPKKGHCNRPRSEDT